MLRTAFAVISGLFAMMIVITFIELASAKFFFPLPPGFNFDDPAAVAAFVTSMPLSAKLTVLGGWLLGSFAGAVVAARIAIEHRLACALAIGVVDVVFTAINAMSIPHPAWMIAAGLLLPLPLAWLGARLATRLAQNGLASTR